MLYEYMGLNCPHTVDGDTVVCEHEVHLPLRKCQDLGKTRKCPLSGCSGRITRVVSNSVNIIIRGNVEVPWNPGEAVMAKVGGKDIKFHFVDHPMGDPNLDTNLKQIGKRMGVTTSRNFASSARMSDKHGRPVVDVVSNVPDPLGKIKRGMNVQGERIPVHNPVKIRKPTGFRQRPPKRDK